MKFLRLVALGTAACAPVAYAMFAVPVEAPLPRLLENAEAKVKSDPKNADNQYLIARLHSLGYAQGDGQVRVYNPDKEINLPYPIQIEYKGNDTLSDAAIQHLTVSINHYSRALGLNEKEAKYWLGYGWMLEQAARWNDQLPTSGEGFPVGLQKKRWFVAAQEAYRRAYHAAYSDDMKKKSRMPGFEDNISAEAAENLLRMDRLDCAKLTPLQVKTFTAHLKAVENFAVWMTPIVFPVHPLIPYSRLEAPFSSVRFNLDGSGQRTWSWITPNAVFLVWNPSGDGKIRSGQQLFGNATFWMLFRHGYAALDSLDNSGDGWLRGAELSGIAAWRDANSNGVSDPGEVQPLATYGIRGISTKAQARVGLIWQNMRGMELWHGGTLPTYDWVARGANGSS